MSGCVVRPGGEAVRGGTHDSFDLVPSTTDGAVAGVGITSSCLLYEAEVGVVCRPLDDLICADVLGQHGERVCVGVWMSEWGRYG